MDSLMSDPKGNAWKPLALCGFEKMAQARILGARRTGEQTATKSIDNDPEVMTVEDGIADMTQERNAGKQCDPERS